jgi:hypothetical protein
MADTNYTSVGVGNSLVSNITDPLGNRSLHPMIKELEIIEYFVQGQRQAVASVNLKLEYTETSIRLSNNNAQLIGISKQVNKWQRKVLVSNKFADKRILTQALVAAGFIARQKSSHPEFAEYHYYQVPDGYKLNYTEVMQLWRTWWHNKRYQLNVASAPIDLLIFNKGNWYPVKDLQPKQGSFILLTARGEISIEAAEYIVWIDAADQILLKGSEEDTVHEKDDYQNNRSLLTTTDLSYGSTSTHKSSSFQGKGLANDWVPEQEEYIDLESYLSTFNTEDSEDIDRIEGIYNIDQLLSGNNILDSVPPPAPKPTKIPAQPPVKSNLEVTPSLPVAPVVNSKLPASKPITTQSTLSLSQRQAALKLKAMNVLATYLHEGDPIVRTEVLKNAQGQEINRKVTKIQRGCPNWAIDQIKKISSYDLGT